MFKVTISALGPLRDKISKETAVDVSTDMTAFQLVEQFGISKGEARMSFNINGRIERGTYLLQPNDKIVVLKMGGAG